MFNQNDRSNNIHTLIVKYTFKIRANTFYLNDWTSFNEHKNFTNFTILSFTFLEAILSYIASNDLISIEMNDIKIVPLSWIDD